MRNIKGFTKNLVAFDGVMSSVAVDTLEVLGLTPIMESQLTSMVESVRIESASDVRFACNLIKGFLGDYGKAKVYVTLVSDYSSKEFTLAI